MSDDDFCKTCPKRATCTEICKALEDHLNGYHARVSVKAASMSDGHMAREVERGATLMARERVAAADNMRLFDVFEHLSDRTRRLAQAVVKKKSENLKKSFDAAGMAAEVIAALEDKRDGKRGWPGLSRDIRALKDALL